MLSSSCLKATTLITTVIIAISTLTACDTSKKSSSQEIEGQQEPGVGYSVWLTNAEITGYKLSTLLKNDEEAANLLCLQDGNTPTDYNHHLALISTPKLDRVDIPERYSLDSSLPVISEETGRKLSKSLDSYLAQTDVIESAHASERDKIKLTLSEGGRFSGYCDSKFGYTPVYNVVNNKGERTHFVTRCNTIGALVCLSVKDKLMPELF